MHMTDYFSSSVAMCSSRFKNKTKFFYSHCLHMLDNLVNWLIAMRFRIWKTNKTKFYVLFSVFLRFELQKMDETRLFHACVKVVKVRQQSSAVEGEILPTKKRKNGEKFVRSPQNFEKLSIIARKFEIFFWNIEKNM